MFVQSNDTSDTPITPDMLSLSRARITKFGSNYQYVYEPVITTDITVSESGLTNEQIVISLGGLINSGNGRL